MREASLLLGTMSSQSSPHEYDLAFPRLSSLPYEVRLMIWELTFVPRIISLFYNNRLSGYPLYEIIGERASHADIRSYAPLPVALSVCQESREVTRRKYQLSFGCHVYRPSVWVNFDIDTIYLDVRFLCATSSSGRRGLPHVGNCSTQCYKIMAIDQLYFLHCRSNTDFSIVALYHDKS